MSFCIVDNFVLANLVMLFCLDIMYCNSWVSASLLINVSNMSIEKQIPDRNIMLTGSKCFLDLVWPLSTDAKGVKSADIGNDCIGGADIGGIYTRGVCTEGICTRDTCTRGTSTRGA